MKKLTFISILFSLFIFTGCYEKTTCCNCSQDAETDGDTQDASDDASQQKNMENCEEEFSE